jgi:putative nucleotidyltransferase with HDIG domain/PAS domain S-box-containing protein
MVVVEDKGSKIISEAFIKQWQTLIETIPNPSYLHDTEFNILLANRALLELFEKTEDIKGMKCAQLIHRDCFTIEELEKESPKRIELYEPSINRFLTVMTSPVRENGDLIGVIHTITDITETKKSELDNIELVDVYANAINELKKKEQTYRKGREAFLNMLDDVHQSYKELEKLFLGLVKAMVHALDAKSPWTRGHSERVATYAEMIAREMGFEEDDLKTLRLAGLLHDIGKIGTVDQLLDKPSRLSDEEFEIVKRHPAQGVEIIKEIKQLQEIIPIIRHHHERVDGKGYPDGLKGDKIPIFSRILHVADSFDSMTSDRPYRPAPGIEYAISELKKYSGIQFDPKVVDAFLRVIEKKKI